MVPFFVLTSIYVGHCTFLLRPKALKGKKADSFPAGVCVGGECVCVPKYSASAVVNSK